jgi:phage terminase small subunit
MTPDAHPAPRHLSPEARAHWVQFQNGWQLDDGARLILMAALEAFDRMRDAQRAIKVDGLMTKAGKLHPATTVERDARLAMLRAIRQLGLDVEPLRDGPGRPPGKGR